MRKLRRLSALLIVLALGFTLPACDPDPEPGYPGVCTGADALTGVTVVVDFQELDGLNGTAAPTITRCSPNPNPGTQRTGIQALQDAGITVTGTNRWGLGFVCRLNDRPSATEDLPIAGNPTYSEPCVNTPPAAAYWSYWHADGTGSDWAYSSYGALNRTVVPGGFEGWSFSLNNTATTNPQPGVEPYNPATDPDAPTVSLSINDLDRVITLGQSTSLTWTSTNATSLQASAVTPTTGGGAWSGALAVPGGSRSVTPTARGTFVYTITANGASGPVSTTATLTVQ